MSPYLNVYLISRLKRSEQGAAQRHNLGGTVFAKGVRGNFNLMYIFSINGQWSFVDFAQYFPINSGIMSL